MWGWVNIYVRSDGTYRFGGFCFVSRYMARAKRVAHPGERCVGTAFYRASGARELAARDRAYTRGEIA